jgi:hypothetical protein
MAENYVPFSENQHFSKKKLPIIWLEIILEFISKIPSQNIGNFKNGFCVFEHFLDEILKYLRKLRTYQKITYQKSFVGPTL